MLLRQVIIPELMVAKPLDLHAESCTNQSHAITLNTVEEETRIQFDSSVSIATITTIMMMNM